MLSRILEPELMDTPEEARDYDAMDHTQVNRVFIADFLAVWNGKSPILDLGTGTALIPIEFCRQSPHGTILAVDAATHMIQLARDNVLRAGLEDRIRCELIDAKRLPMADRSISAIMSNSIVHHIPDPSTVFAEIARVAEPGASILVRDLLRPADQATLNRLVDLYAVDATDHQRKMFADSLHAALSLNEVRNLVAAVGHDPSRVRQTTDRHWTWTVN